MRPHERLGQIIEGKVVIVGMGNCLRGDDGLGPSLMERLKKKLDITCINAGSTLENYLGKIVREDPDTVLLIDAVHLGLEPGAYEIMDPEEVNPTGFSTHDISPKMHLDLLSRSINGKIFLLGVQPGQLTLGSKISAEVRKTLRILERRITKAVSRIQLSNSISKKQLR